MKTILPLSLGTRYLRTRHRSLALVGRFAVIGLTLSIAVLYLVQMLISGFQEEMNHRMLAVYPNVTVHHKANKIPNDGLDHLIEENPFFVAWTASLDGVVVLAGNEQVRQTKVFGVDPETFNTVSAVDQFMDEPFDQTLEKGKFGVVLGDQIAHALDLEVGDPVQVIRTDFALTPLGIVPRSKQFTLTGIVNTGSILDNQIIYAHRDDLTKFLGAPQFGNRIHVRVQDPMDIPSHLFDLTRQLTLEYGFPSEGISTWSSFMSLQYRFLRIMENVFFLLLSLLVAVASFNLVSTMIMIVHERQSDIAILRTFGSNARNLTLTFVLVSGFIALIGIVGGTVLAWILGYVLEWIFPWLAKTMNLDAIDVIFIKAFEVHWLLSDLIKVLLLGGGLAMLAAAFPAYRAAKVLPAEVLRYE